MHSREREAVTDTRDASVSNDDLLSIKEHIASVQALVNNVSSVEVAHACGYLLGNIETLLQREHFTPDVQLLV